MTPLATVFRLQLKLLWTSRRAPYLLTLLIGMIVMIEFIVMRVKMKGVSAAALLGEMLPVLIVLGALWPTVVWRDEGPARRHTHWSMPVDVSVHDLARVLAGATWLVAAMMTTCAVGFALAAAQGTVADLGGGGAARFTGFVLAPLLTYVLVSILGVSVNRPLEWLMALYALMVVLILVTLSAGVDVFQRTFSYILGPRMWGLWHAIYAGVEAAARDASALTPWLASWSLWMVIGLLGVVQATLLRRGRA